MLPTSFVLLSTFFVPIRHTTKPTTRWTLSGKGQLYSGVPLAGVDTPPRHTPKANSYSPYIRISKILDHICPFFGSEYRADIEETGRTPYSPFFSSTFAFEDMPIGGVGTPSRLTSFFNFPLLSEGYRACYAPHSPLLLLLLFAAVIIFLSFQRIQTKAKPPRKIAFPSPSELSLSPPSNTLPLSPPFMSVLGPRTF